MVVEGQPQEQPRSGLHTRRGVQGEGGQEAADAFTDLGESREKEEGTNINCGRAEKRSDYERVRMPILADLYSLRWLWLLQGVA